MNLETARHYLYPLLFSSVGNNKIECLLHSGSLLRALRGWFLLISLPTLRIGSYLLEETEAQRGWVWSHSAFVEPRCEWQACWLSNPHRSVACWVQACPVAKEWSRDRHEFTYLQPSGQTRVNQRASVDNGNRVSLWDLASWICPVLPECELGQWPTLSEPRFCFL